MRVEIGNFVEEPVGEQISNSLVGDSGRLLEPKQGLIKLGAKLSLYLGVEEWDEDLMLSLTNKLYTSFAVQERPQTNKELFDDLVTKWREATGGSSNPNAKIYNRHFLSIIGMGQPAIPLILGELSNRPSLLVEALPAITRVELEKPPGAKFRDIVNQWIEWGRSQSYL